MVRASEGMAAGISVSASIWKGVWLISWVFLKILTFDQVTFCLNIFYIYIDFDSAFKMWSSLWPILNSVKVVGTLRLLQKNAIIYL